MVFPYMETVVGIMILMYIFETYLNLRQEAALKLPTLLKTLEGVISQQTFEKSRNYNLDKSTLHLVKQFVMIVMESAILFFGVLPWFWKKSGDVLETVGLDAENEICHTLAFLAGYKIWYKITDLPFSLVSTFVIAQDYGFNKQTIWMFIGNMLKDMILAIILGPPFVAATILIVQKIGPNLSIYLWGFISAWYLFIMTIHPVLAESLFKLTPKKLPQLRTKIETLASSLNFPLKNLYVVDGSTWSSHNNVCIYGLFNNKRIALVDTLIQQCKNEEKVVAVIAHELGHWKMNHALYSFIAFQIHTLLQFGGYALVKNSNDLFRSFGFDAQPLVIGYILFQYTTMPFQHLVSFGKNLLARASEFQADAFAKKLGYAKPLRDRLVQLQERSWSVMNTDPWYSAYNCSHPPLVERIAALDEADKKAD